MDEIAGSMEQAAEVRILEASRDELWEMHVDFRVVRKLRILMSYIL